MTPPWWYSVAIVAAGCLVWLAFSRWVDWHLWRRARAMETRSHARYLLRVLGPNLAHTVCGLAGPGDLTALVHSETNPSKSVRQRLRLARDVVWALNVPGGLSYVGVRAWLCSSNPAITWSTRTPAEILSDGVEERSRAVAEIALAWAEAR